VIDAFASASTIEKVYMRKTKQTQMLGDGDAKAAPPNW